MAPSAVQSKTLQTSVLILNLHPLHLWSYYIKSSLIHLYHTQETFPLTSSAPAEGVFTGYLKCLIYVQFDNSTAGITSRSFRNGQILHSQC